MKYEVAARYDYYTDNVLLVVGFSDGVYRVDFNASKVEFSKDCFNIEQPDFILTTAEFTLKNLTEKKNVSDSVGTIMSKLFEGRTITRGDRTIEFVIEFLDTSIGKIPYHSHPDNVREVYLSMDAPFVGNVCPYNGMHEPFSDHTLAIKLIVQRH